MTTQFAHGHGAPRSALAGGGAGGFGGWLAGLVRSARRRAAEYERFVRTRNELLALSDRDLDDIGLSRAEVEMIGRKACGSAR